MVVELTTSAEQRAAAAQQIDGFREFSLAGTKNSVAEILNMIGRVNGIFSTYTLHDISHINAMLKMLDWLVPPTTRDKMSCVDWLLSTLAIYFHDLGMAVAQQEFNDRNENPAFQSFVDRLQSDPDATDFRRRVDALPNEKIDQFYFQEFIRSTHASRIRNWISGRNTERWGSGIRPVVSALHECLGGLPSRFREHLAIVCESHHRDNLDKRELFPLAQRYGSDPAAIANVQYSAVLLRTTDLLHVTQDRTPSVMYQMIGLTDPLGIDEWKKQQGTFSVGMKSRDFDAADHDNHFVVVGADFSEERPFFSLTEYLAYADEQIKQSKRWIDKSQEDADGNGFWFPWHRVQGDIRVEGSEPQQLRFELDRGRLLTLLVGHTIYNDSRVVIRELLQNAIDATRYHQHAQAKKSSAASNDVKAIQVHWNSADRDLIVRDFGTGMDLDTIKNHLLTVGSSFYDTPQFQADNVGFSPISRFGIGVLTCFMVSDDIEIITCRQDRGYRIRMSSVHANYLLKRLERDDPLLRAIGEHGTQVRIRLRPSVDLSKMSVLDILKHWIVLPACAVEYLQEGMQPTKIGFDSLEEAVKALIREDESEHYEGYGSRDRVEVQEHSTEGEEYRMGFATVSYFSTWNTFRQLRHAYKGAVCIEGIRVDHCIPGINQGAIRGILSVRGNRKFRTTVARTSLERDSEYYRVGQVCCRMLLDHIESEVESVSNKEGRPLSQASSAARGLVRSLRSMLDDQETLAICNEHYRELPSVVVEETQKNGRRTQTDRKLISRRQLDELQEFWMIESRLVSSLGSISRDLGRELSLNDFLSALAPDLIDDGVNPIVLEAEKVEESIIFSHVPQQVVFSRKQQQTNVRLSKGRSWGKFLKDNRPWIDEESHAEAVERAVELIDTPGIHIDHRRHVIQHSLQNMHLFELAEISGDEESVCMIKTKVCPILQQDSAAGKSLTAIREAYTADIEAPGLPVSDKSLVALTMMGLIAWANAGSFLDNERDDQGNLARKLWDSITRNDLFRQLSKVPEIVPPKLDDVFCGKQSFDVSTYWYNWDQF